MIPFDPEKTILLNIGIDVFSGMIILIIYHNFKPTRTPSACCASPWPFSWITFP